MGGIKGDITWEDDRVFGQVLNAMATNGFVDGLGTDEMNRSLGNMIPFDFKEMLMTMLIKDAPL